MTFTTKHLNHLERAEVKGRRLLELTSRKYLHRAVKNATLKALDELQPLAHWLPPFETFPSYGPRVEEKSHYADDFDTPWNVLMTYDLELQDDDHYYDLMAFAGSCKDPFCDAECPLTLDTIGDTPVVVLKIEKKAGPAICRIKISSLLPHKIESHLRDKGIIQREHYSYSGSSGVNTNIVCPT